MSPEEVLKLVEAGRYFTVTGTNTYVGTSVAPNPRVKSYNSRKSYYIYITNANTGPSTLNIDGVGAGAIRKFGTLDVDAGDLPALNIIEVVWDGTSFQAIGGGIIYAFINQKINSAASNFCQTII